jgi:hypothetical protein
LNDAERELEGCLKGLRPAGHNIDRDAMMFRAGQRSMARRARGWQSAAGIMLVVVLNLSWFHLAPGSGPASSSVAVQSSPGSPGDPSATAVLTIRPGSGWQGSRPELNSPYLRVRRLLTTEGVDALPAPAASAPVADLVRSLADWRRASQI